MSKRITISTGLLLLLFCGFQNTLTAMPVSGTRTTDSLALVALYNSTDGPNWTDKSNWLTASTLDNWYGITLTGDRVTRLQLDHNLLAGTIPDEIGDLTAVTQFWLNNNQLTGEIPDVIDVLASATHLYLHYNQLSGTIPATISDMNSLKYVYFHHNQLSGTIPAEIADINSLMQIQFHDNQLSGSIPTEICNINLLETLYLYNNQLTGTIPTNLGDLTELLYLKLSNNQLTGSIPVSIGNLSKLVILFLTNNQLSGTIPPGLGDLTDLTQLYLSQNNFTGTIPEELCNLTNLTYLYLNSNELSGSIPDSIGKLNKVIYLYLNENDLGGTIPTSIGGLVGATKIGLGENQLTGAVPAELTNLGLNLTDFRVNYNQLTDCPNISIMAAQGALTDLWIEGNRFTFEDIEPNLTIPTFRYHPQDSVGALMDTTVFYGEGITFDMTVGGDNNQYQWYKDDILYSGATNPVLTISPTEWADTGAWTCRITNTLATDLTLESHPINLTVIQDPFEADSLALVDLYNNTNGASWTDNSNWLTATELDKWFGITVSDGRVTHIELVENNVAGSIPASLYDMSALEGLTIRDNPLTGTISSDIDKLSKLNFLDLAFGQLSGAIPEELGNCTELTAIIIDFNQFTGTIPQSLGKLKKLDALFLGGNQLTGSIPDAMCTLPLLRTFHLFDNQLTGSIPAAIGDLDSLASIRFEGNQLSGTIPSGIGNLKKLTHLWIQTNQFTGAVPTAITGMDSLKSFKIFDNQFTDFPDVSSMVPQLKWVRIWNNKFTFEDIEPNVGAGLLAFNYDPQDSVGIPKDTSAVEGESITLSVSVGGDNNVYQWYKDGSLLSGAEESSYTVDPAAFEDAGSYNVHVTNTIATDLTLFTHPINLTIYTNYRMIDSLALVALYDSTDGDNWNTNTNWKTAEPLDNWYKVKMLNARVDEINLGGNNLAGVIPDEIGNLTGLTILVLVANSLTGPIPTAIGNLTNLETLNLVSNALTGTIPDVIYDLTKLTNLSMQNNYTIEGTISPKIGQLTNLEILMFESMSLEGPIPDEICNLTNLRLLKLGNNQDISGTIPANIGNLVNLKDFSVYNNSLTGTIPDGIGNLVNLEKLVFSGNSMTGTIPDFIGNLTKLTELQFSKNEFFGAIPDTMNNLTAIVYLALNDNAFDELNSLSSMSALNTLSIYNNKFTFEDIEPNIGVPATNYFYSPQDSLGEVVDSTIIEGDDLTISVSVGGTENLYQWMKDGTDISGATANTYSIYSAISDDAGNYVCKITNTIATELTLYSSNFNVTVNPINAIADDETGMPKSYALYQNYPNPFNPTTTIRYDLPKASKVTVHIYNVLGNRVKTVVNGVQTAGRKSLVWDGRDEHGSQVASGIYFYQITAPGFSKTMKMLMVK